MTRAEMLARLCRDYRDQSVVISGYGHPQHCRLGHGLRLNPRDTDTYDQHGSHVAVNPAYASGHGGRLATLYAHYLAGYPGDGDRDGMDYSYEVRSID